MDNNNNSSSNSGASRAYSQDQLNPEYADWSDDSIIGGYYVGSQDGAPRNIDRIKRYVRGAQNNLLSSLTSSMNCSARVEQELAKCKRYTYDYHWDLNESQDESRHHTSASETRLDNYQSLMIRVNSVLPSDFNYAVLGQSDYDRAKAVIIEGKRVDAVAEQYRPRSQR